MTFYSPSNMRARFRLTGIGRTAGLGLVAVTLHCLSAQAQETSAVLFENVSVLTMESDRVLTRQDVLVAEGRIVNIAGHPLDGLPEDIRRIDGSEKFLMPGLMDAHVHIWRDAAERINDEHAAKRLLVHGVTRARVAFGEAEMIEWRDKVERGQEAGARLLLASPYITTSVETEDFILSNPTNAEVRAAIRQYAKQGYDYIKVVSVPDQTLLDAILEEAGTQGLPILGHYPKPDLPLDIVVRGSWKSVEHFDILMEVLREQQGVDFDLSKVIAHFNSVGGAITTVGLFFETEIDAGSSIGQDLRQFVNSGGTLLAGTEGNFGPGGLGNSLHLELEKLVALGLTPYQAIQAATVKAGPYLAKGDKVGFLAAGHAADLILLSENPLKDVKALRALEGVMVAGRWYDDEALAQIRHALPPLP